MAIAAALTLNHATDLFANTLVMHCLSLMHSRGNNVIYDAAQFDREEKKREKKRVREVACASRIVHVNKIRVREGSITVSYEFAITVL